MVSFRRLVLAIAVLALFTGLASAQVVGIGGAGALTCTASVAAPPQLRAEGLTENIGDVVLVCTGGVPLALGAVVPTANITVSLGTNVTSRLLGAGTASSPSNASEALLLVDEPGSLLAGSIAAQTLCSNSALGSSFGGCVETANGAGGWQAASTVAPIVLPPASVFQGLVSGNQVTFNGIPINPPGSAGARVYRITNVRANASGIGGGGLQGTTALTAFVSITGGSTSLPISNAALTAGYIQPGLSTGTGVRSATAPSGSSSGNTFNQCSSATLSATAIVRFAENFAAAFKTRTNSPGVTGQTATTAQNSPGQIYASESNFTYNVGASNIAGLADYGTRLKAVFNNIPSGVSIFVTTTNFPGSGNVSSATQGSNPTTVTIGSVSSLAGLVSSETLVDSNNLAPLVAGSTTVNSGNTNLVQLPIVNGQAIAVWEVLQTNPNLSEAFDFGVYITYSANVASNSPVPGSGTVNLSFAPTPTQGAFSASAGAAASSSLTIPRFADTSTASNFVTVVICQTSLLFPFVTNINGFDTGIAIANTTTDPFGTKAQSGACNMSFYGSTPPTAAVSTGNIATGTVYTTTAGASAPNFQGYMIAVCNFQLAHGFAFVSDVGARNLAMGYLALILPGGTSSRPSSSGTATFNENFGIVH